jgi:hypothetical protein
MRVFEKPAISVFSVDEINLASAESKLLQKVGTYLRKYTAYYAARK